MYISKCELPVHLKAGFKMANEEHVKLLKRGAKAWNEWRSDYPAIVPELARCNMEGVNLSGAFLWRANLERSNLSRTILKDTCLRLARANTANLKGADLRGTDLTGADLGWTDLRGAMLTGANLSMTKLFRAAMNNAKIRDANLIFADLTGADLSGADLSGANLSGAIFNDANLRNADLTGANLFSARLESTKINETDFSKTTFGFSTLINLDLSAAKNIDSVSHIGPSSVAIDTIFNSKGMIPEVFLKGAGVPDEFINFFASTRPESAPLFHSCFIYYSSKDDEYFRLLQKELLQRHIRSSYLCDSEKWDEEFWGEIDRVIANYEKLIVICSENSLKNEKASWIIERALQRGESEGTNILLPVQIDDYLAGKWKHEKKDEVVKKVAADFTGWKKDNGKYEAGIESLMGSVRK
jgi:uncharacterized protein YjbI with pentapeptide repeats